MLNSFIKVYYCYSIYTSKKQKGTKRFMEIAVIIAICTSSFTAIMAIANMILSITQLKGANRLAIVTSGRIKYLDKIRDAHAEFIGRTAVAVIRGSAINKCQNYAIDLCVAAEGLKTYLKPFYEIDQKLIQQIDNLTEMSLRQFENPHENYSSELLKSRNIYYKLYSQYDWSYWKYIQAQYIGNVLDSDKDFDAVYMQTKEQLESPNYKWE